MSPVPPAQLLPLINPRFVGEESYSKGASRDYLIDESPTWCVDPLDGTVNYIHLFPMFCVSIAFIHKNKPMVGVIYAPFINQFFSSCTGRGAFLNETQQLPLVRNPIAPMPENAPAGCVFSCEWGKDRRDIPDGNMHRKIESFVNMASELGSRSGRGGMVHGVRSLGSATLDLAYVAMGSFDIWWEGGCWEWYVQPIKFSRSHAHLEQGRRGRRCDFARGRRAHDNCKPASRRSYMPNTRCQTR